MLSVILLILRIIGIAVLVLLGILLFLLLIILFVPVRYRFKLEHGDGFTLDGGISWLLHFVHGRILQTGSDRRIWLRIMGILVYDSLRPPKRKKVRQKRSKSSTVSKEGDPSKDEASPKDDVLPGDDALSKDIMLTEDDTSSKDGAAKDSKQPTYEEPYSKSSFFARIYKKIKDKIINFITGISNKIKMLIQRFLRIKNKVRLIYDFINDDINRKGFRFTFDTISKILKHIRPKVLRSRLIFGTGDPCSTGQALGIFGIFYGLYGSDFQVTPDFENKVFKGSHYVRGRIRFWTLLIIVIKLLLDKRFKDLRMNYQLLKEAL